ncbi:unnamed protein product [Somion occarium]|uniref:Uncharacterized protein n=1 Tax=Somion occarium TaxID=3059160 RepID=A0ABP1DJ15_9APHY
MEHIIRVTRADLASATMSRSSGDVSLSTLVGLGTTSGKAVMKVGEIVVQGVDMIGIAVRLHRIGNMLEAEHGHIPHDCYEEVLEYGRPGLYPRLIRTRAWTLLLRLMERQRVQGIVDTLVQWYELDIQMFIRQLYIFKSSGWQMRLLTDPRVVSDSRLPNTPQLSVNEQDKNMASSYLTIISSLLRSKPNALRGEFLIEELVFLITPTTAIDIAMEKNTGSQTLFRLYNHIALEYKHGHSDRWRTFPLAAWDAIEYLRMEGPDHCIEVMHHALHHLQPFASIEQQPSHNTSLAVYESAGLQIHVHPALPIILFVAHLCLRHPTAFEIFLGRGFLDILERMWLLDFPGTVEDDSGNLIGEDLRTACCIALSVFSAYRHNLAEQLREYKRDWFMEVCPHFLQHYDEVNATRIRLPGVEHHRPGDREEFYAVLVQELSSIWASERLWDTFFMELHEGRSLHVSRAILELEVDDAKTVLHWLSVFSLSDMKTFVYKGTLDEVTPKHIGLCDHQYEIICGLS